MSIKLLFKRAKEASDYYNEAAGQYGLNAPDPYYFARPAFIRGEQAKAVAYRQQTLTEMRPFKKRRFAAPRRSGYSRRIRRRRPSFRRGVAARPSKRKFKRQARMSIGNPVKHLIPTKHRIIQAPVATVVPNTTIQTLNMLNLGTLGTAQNQRDTNTVDVRGFKIQMTVEQTTLAPTYFNWAIISPKGTFSSTSTFDVGEFFRDYGIQRNINFAQASLNGMQFHMRPISTDTYSVLCHKRCLLAAGTDGRTKLGIKTWNTYVKLGREIRYDLDGDTLPVANQVWLCYWCSLYQTPVSTVLANAATVSGEFMTYFKDA